MVIRWKESFSLLNSLENFAAKRFLKKGKVVLANR